MPKRILQGLVVSDKGDKTIIVRVERRVMHPVYKKFVTRSKKYAAHDEENKFHTGDAVQIEECRPISKRKSWMVLGEATGAAPGLARRRARVAEAVPDAEAASEAEGEAEVAAVEAGAAL